MLHGVLGGIRRRPPGGKNLAVRQHVDFPCCALETKRTGSPRESIPVECEDALHALESSSVSTCTTTSASFVRRGGGVFKRSSGTRAPIKEYPNARVLESIDQGDHCLEENRIKRSRHFDPRSTAAAVQPLRPPVPCRAIGVRHTPEALAPSVRAPYLVRVRAQGPESVARSPQSSRHLPSVALSARERSRW